MPSPAPHVVVVGGGISGLAAAFALTRARPAARVTVLEAADTVGGKLRSVEIAGVRVDSGAESMLARRPEGMALARDAGLDVLHPATTAATLWVDRFMHNIPARTVTGIPGDIEALRASDLLRPAELERVLAEPALPGLPLHEDVAIGELVRTRLGQAVLDRLVEPLLGGVYAGLAENLSLDATAPALGAALRTHTSLLRAAAELVPVPDVTDPRPVFAGLDGGLATLPDAVAKASGATVRTGTTVRELRPQPGGGWRLVLGSAADPETLTADAVVLAVPAAPAARLLADVAPYAAAELAGIQYASMAIVTLAYRAADVAQRLRGSGFLVPPSEGRLVKGVTFTSNKWAWVAERDPELFVLRGSVGRYGDERSLQRDDVDLARAVVHDIADATWLSAEPVAYAVTRWGGGLPQYAVGHRDRVARITSAVEATPGLAVCGAAYDGVGIPACIASGHEAATRVTRSLQPGATMGA